MGTIVHISQFKKGSSGELRSLGYYRLETFRGTVQVSGWTTTCGPIIERPAKLTLLAIKDPETPGGSRGAIFEVRLNKEPLQPGEVKHHIRVSSTCELILDDEERVFPKK